MRKSAGILLYRVRSGEPEVFLVHPGGPFWKNKDAGAWSIPKGEYSDVEDPLQAAVREFREETGASLAGEFIELTSVRQKAGKVVSAWALEENIDPATIVSNTFPIEWPPKSGKWIQVPEVDKGEWFTLEVAKEKINPGQVAFLEELKNRVIG